MRKLPLLGELTQHPTIPEWWVSRALEVRFLAKTIPFTVTVRAEADEYPGDVTDAITRFLALGPTDRGIAAKRVFEYYRLYADAVPEADLALNVPEDVWPHIQVRYAAIQRKGLAGRHVYVLVVCDCDWDDEHGLQLLYRDGSDLIQVGEQDGGVTHAQEQDAEPGEGRSGGRNQWTAGK